MSHGLACRDAVTALTLTEWQMGGVIPKSFVLQETSPSRLRTVSLIILK